MISGGSFLSEHKFYCILGKFSSVFFNAACVPFCNFCSSCYMNSELCVCVV